MTKHKNCNYSSCYDHTYLRFCDVIVSPALIQPHKFVGLSGTAY